MNPHHNYWRKMATMVADGTLDVKKNQTVDILHDDWCALLNGGDTCNCDPTITVREGLHPPLHRTP